MKINKSKYVYYVRGWYVELISLCVLYATKFVVTNLHFLPKRGKGFNFL